MDLSLHHFFLEVFSDFAEAPESDPSRADVENITTWKNQGTMLSTSEGFEYTPRGGLKPRLVTDAVVSPAQLSASPTELYDVIIVGAGYAGLIAARDLTARGRKVLLIEARDRIGGRTWSCRAGSGDIFDMGGTYIHWTQPHVWTEIVRYGLKETIKDCVEPFERSVPPSMILNGEGKNRPAAELDAWLGKAMSTFYNPDGIRSTDAVPYPHSPLYNQACAAKHDGMSARDRFEQLRGILNEDELGINKAYTLIMSGPPLESASYFDLLQRWVLGGATPDQYAERMTRFKLKGGQTELTRRIFNDILATGNCSYTFSTPIQAIDHSGLEKVSVMTVDGRCFRARKAICTIPLAVLKSIRFTPSLPPLKAEAIAEGRGNFTRKFHALAEGRQWRSWSCVRYNSSNNNGGEAVMASGDSQSASGEDTNLVVFSAGDSLKPHFSPREQLETLQSLDAHLKVKRLIFTDYNDDPYAGGSWCVFQPGYMTKYLGALQSSVGNLKFASGDIADGWRGFIDGAIESATLVAREVEGELLGLIPVPPPVPTSGIGVANEAHL
ncbi:uncharacterized protein Z518_05838 [Rhinocladiella mackenziei CBS 650.93]|uniref:Amine oxidase n=1 Tax=Rhinocladiella mackenziei CBS 650.93 TaxID=1442369 RepID=A0A0D2IP90_9EURO|nr:uncharacterized protein Z518_05838 [Rhinocladiella mackenziei CBS 650.93]KIX04966.1 hypothetical protein Z518_05838 [Rhinocladiella mackenziei CBS 650.93]